MSTLALIVEDEEDLADIFAQAVLRVGYEVEHIADGQVAKERLTSEPVPYLVLLDMHLPHVSGADLLLDMKNDPRFDNTTIIITTADARMGQTYDEMADFVLIKPISFVQLRDLANRLRPKEE